MTRRSRHRTPGYLRQLTERSGCLYSSNVDQDGGESHGGLDVRLVVSVQSGAGFHYCSFC